MFQTLALPRVVYDVRPFLLKGLKVLHDAALQDKESKRTFVEKRGRTRPERDKEALQRHLSRTELELADPEAVRRRETMARLKLATASIKA